MYILFTIAKRGKENNCPWINKMLFVSRIVKFMEKSRIVVTKAWTGAGGKGLVLLLGSEFQFGTMPAFRRWW